VGGGGGGGWGGGRCGSAGTLRGRSAKLHRNGKVDTPRGKESCATDMQGKRPNRQEVISCAKERTKPLGGKKGDKLNRTFEKGEKAIRRRSAKPTGENATGGQIWKPHRPLRKMGSTASEQELKKNTKDGHGGRQKISTKGGTFAETAECKKGVRRPAAHSGEPKKIITHQINTQSAGQCISYLNLNKMNAGNCWEASRGTKD